MAANVMLNGSAVGVVVMSAPNQTLTVLGGGSFEDQNGLWNDTDDEGFCSMVAYDPDFIAQVQAAGASGLSVQYATKIRNGTAYGVGLVAQETLELCPALVQWVQAAATVAAATVAAVTCSENFVMTAPPLNTFVA